MIKTLTTAAVISVASFGLIGSAMAQAGAAGTAADPQGQFYATPVQKGVPTDLPGERMIPGASQTAMMMDGMMRPMMAPMGEMMGGTETAAAEPAAMPMKKKHHMMMHKHHMMKKSM